MNLVVIGLSHHAASVAWRERYAFAAAQIPGRLQALRAAGLAAEAVILSTCNRVEIYAATPLEPARAFAGLAAFFHEHQAGPGAPPPGGDPPPLYTLAEPQSLHHLFKVASGLDSMVLGETEILGQLKTAYALAHAHHHTGARLNKAFQRAFHVAKHIRTETSIQRGNVSVASVAVDLAEKIFSTLASRAVLILGAGDTGEKVARALLSRGARALIVANRSADRAAALAAELGGRTVPFDDWSREFDAVDIVISSTASPTPILDAPKLETLMRARRHRPLLLVDIAVPRDIDPAVNFLENVYLYNIDDLQSIAAESMNLRRQEIARCEQIIADKARPLLHPASASPAPEAAPRGLNPSAA